ncbi:4-hydroxy-tetrahydrodipicolinate synthase [Pedobacter westerhofensis]|uniref:4-hydroxy-tetrahydrodipicolinate synthase n=1 Tax=Pedobacter westerhofensis TaxID=425512 RepID=A0A521AMS9_9SPHI|nr:dihydrodipicolinate synthase family protein [Pedobacter westerhofensis]SMO36128.1 4-hydroxy-tetrahydrodipicolinate synthase [Pedobacter westerhofensis]
MEKSEKGFIPVMLTPFSDDGKIDYYALEQLTAHYLGAGVKGLFANCLSSEMFELSNEERISLTAKVVEIADGTVPVVATGTFGGSITQQAEFVKRIYDTGIDAVILITSLIAEENDAAEVFDEKVMQLLDLTPSVPVGFYECPLPFKRLLTAEQLGTFVATGRVTYHKDTSLDIQQVKAKLVATQREGFGLYDAYMVHALASLRAGSAGLSCIQGNFFPELIVWLCENYNNPALEEDLAALQEFLILHMDVMHDVYPYAAKYALQKQGLNISTYTRRDVGHFSSANAKGIEQLYADYSRLQQRIGI